MLNFIFSLQVSGIMPVSGTRGGCLMIKIRVGEMKPDDGAIDAIFRGNYEDEWFDDPFVKNLVMEIDSSEVVSPNLIISPVLGPLSFEKLSGGVKCLLCYMKCQRWSSGLQAVGTIVFLPCPG